MFSRRALIATLVSSPSAGFLGRPAFADNYPDRRVQVIVTTAAGGSSDVVTRLTCQFISEHLNQTFLVDNRPGAGGNIAVEQTHRAPADGYTLLAIHKGMVAANSLADGLPFDFLRDFEGVAGVSNGPLVMLVHPSVPVKSLAEFIAYAKANPGKLNYASAGSGTDPHLAGELIKMQAGIDMTHVPYKGGAMAFTDLLGGSVQVMFTNLPAAEYVRTEKLRALAVTTRTRSPSYPDVQAVAEAVPGYEFGVWFAYVTRKGTPRNVISLLNNEFSAALKDPKVVSGLAILDSAPMSMTADELTQFLVAESAKWAKVIKAANIRTD